MWLTGEHDLFTVFAVAETLAAAIAAVDADLVVDLREVTFMDAATIGELIRGRNVLLDYSRTLTLRSPSPFNRRTLDVCGLSALVELTPMCA